MSLNYMLPNGVTIGFNSAAERDAYLGSAAGSGAQTQESVAAANPGQDIRQIADDRGMAWNAPGGQGYLDAMAQGHNDPSSDPRNPQPFTQQAMQQYSNGAGVGGGLLGGGGSGGLLGGGGMGGGTPGGGQAPGIGQFGGNTMGQPASTTPLHSAAWNPTNVQPTIPTFQQQPQTFDDILSKYSNFRVPMPSGGINWMSPSVSPGAVNVMDANLSRRYL